MKTLLERVCAYLNTEGPPRWKVRRAVFVTTRLDSGRIFYAQQVRGSNAWEALTCAAMTSKAHEDCRYVGCANTPTSATPKQLGEVVSGLLKQAMNDKRNASLYWPRFG